MEDEDDQWGSRRCEGRTLTERKRSKYGGVIGTSRIAVGSRMGSGCRRVRP